jgi:flavin reductase (DIM6/NTAB) family NADH-FMN oxidoreductase RutF
METGMIPATDTGARTGTATGRRPGPATGTPAGTPTRAPAARPTGSSGELRSVLGRFATGVTVLTAGRHEPRAMTANSFTSVSLAPPLVLVCVARSAAVHAAVLAEGSFAVSVLAAGQQHLARRFADPGRPRGPREFDGVDTFRGPHTDVPLLAGALAWIECALTAVHDGGDHSILLGSVLGSAPGNPAEPLLYFRGGFAGTP